MKADRDRFTPVKQIKDGMVSMHSPSNFTVYTHAVQQESFTDSSDSDDEDDLYNKGIHRMNSSDRSYSQWFSVSADRFPSLSPKRSRSEQSHRKTHQGGHD